MSKPLISICIPTYNRADFLKDCLTSIVSQFESTEIKNLIEITISDNASSDATQEIVKNFQSKYNNINYFRNEKNLGVDRNILNIVAKSSGEYCLTIGDDDAFLPGSIPLLIKTIQISHLPYYMLNSWGYDHELLQPLLKTPALNIVENKSYKNLTEYARTITKYTNLVGYFCGLSHLFKRDMWMNFQDKENYISTNAIHYFIIVDVFKQSPCMAIAQPVIKTRSSNIRWNVFPGLESIQGRIKSTIKLVLWVREKFDLPLSSIKIYIYFYTREYWFTLKEVIKRLLSKMRLTSIIDIYRRLR